MFYWNRSYDTTVVFFIPNTQPNVEEVKTNGNMEYGTGFIWKHLSLAVGFKHDTYTDLKLAHPVEVIKPFLNYVFSRLPHFWPSVFTIQSPWRQNSVHSNLHKSTMKRTTAKQANAENYTDLSVFSNWCWCEVFLLWFMLKLHWVQTRLDC